jgi:hypothetical protein
MKCGFAEVAMLSYEWRELETLCERVADLRERYTYARRSKNHGLLESLKSEIGIAIRQREPLVRHIATRLGSVVTDQHQMQGHVPESAIAGTIRLTANHPIAPSAVAESLRPYAQCRQLAPQEVRTGELCRGGAL